MTQDAINQRLKVLVEALGMNVRSFSMKIGVSDSTARNYIDRGSRPPADFIATVVNSIERINPAWLLLGRGEMFLTNQAEVEVVDVKRPGTIEQVDYEKEALRREVEQLKALVAAKNDLIAAKDEMLTLLRRSTS